MTPMTGASKSLMISPLLQLLFGCDLRFNNNDRLQRNIGRKWPDGAGGYAADAADDVHTVDDPAKRRIAPSLLRLGAVIKKPVKNRIDKKMDG